MINVKYQVLRVDLAPGTLSGEVAEGKIYLDSNFNKCTALSIVSFNFSTLSSPPPALVNKENDVYIESSDLIILDWVPEKRFIPWQNIRSIKPYSFKTDIDIKGNSINCKIRLNDDTVILPFIGVVPYIFVFKLTK